jgi:hypothetical protein
MGVGVNVGAGVGVMVLVGVIVGSRVPTGAVTEGAADGMVLGVGSGALVDFTVGLGLGVGVGEAVDDAVAAGIWAVSASSPTSSDCVAGTEGRAGGFAVELDVGVGDPPDGDVETAPICSGVARVPQATTQPERRAASTRLGTTRRRAPSAR